MVPAVIVSNGVHGALTRWALPHIVVKLKDTEIDLQLSSNWER